MDDIANKKNSIFSIIFYASLTASLLWVPELLYKYVIHDIIRDQSTAFYEYFGRGTSMVAMFILGAFGFITFIYSIRVSGLFAIVLGAFVLAVLISWNIDLGDDKTMGDPTGVAIGLILYSFPIYGMMLYIFMMVQWDTFLGRAIRGAMINAVITLVSALVAFNLVPTGGGDADLPIWIFLILFLSAASFRWISERSLIFHGLLVALLPSDIQETNMEIEQEKHEEKNAKKPYWFTIQESITSGVLACFIAFFMAVITASAGKEAWLLDPIAGDILGWQPTAYTIPGLANSFNSSSGLEWLLYQFNLVMIVLKFNFYWSGIFDCILNQIPYMGDELLSIKKSKLI